MQNQPKSKCCGADWIMTLDGAKCIECKKNFEPIISREHKKCECNILGNCDNCLDNAFEPTVPIEESVNYLQTMDEAHCYFCHKNYKPSEDKEHIIKHYQNVDTNLGECSKLESQFEDCKKFHSPTPSKTEEWAKRFDEQFTYGVLLSASSDLSAGTAVRFSKDRPDLVKQFIKDTLTQQRTHILDEIEQMKLTRILSINGTNAGKMKTEGYHQALRQLSAFLKQE